MEHRNVLYLFHSSPCWFGAAKNERGPISKVSGRMLNKLLFS